MATPRRRSARLSKAAQQQHPSPRKGISTAQLESLVERDETPEVGEPQSIANVLATPASSAMIKSHLSKLSGLKTPRTEPQADRGEMHPQLLHQTTTKAPDSGLKMGFVDVPAHPPRSIASAQNTPSKARLNTPANLSSTAFDFDFGSESQLSSEAQKLMDNVREEAARIKAQMRMEREVQKKKDAEAEDIFSSTNAAGRKIAKPKGKAGRFSDIHMAQFKKMDSIANHPSAFRAKPGFAQPTAQSLKRSGSKAGLDEADRPRTAGKGTPGRKPPPFLGRPTSISPFKSIPAQQERVESTAPAKRARRSELHDVSASRPLDQPLSARPSTLPRPVSSNLLSPTKASMARATTSQIPIATPNKVAKLTRTTSAKSLRATSTALNNRPSTSYGECGTKSSSGLQQKETLQAQRPLPPLPREARSSSALNNESLSKPVTENAATTSGPSFSSRLPKFSSLKSILRSGRKTDIGPLIEERQATPKRPNTATSTNGSLKKVDFTPSVKSRYAVKLAAGSPSPAKLPQLSPGKPIAPVVPYDPAAYTVEDDGAWEDASSEIEYPALPDPSSSPAALSKVDNAFAEKAKEHNRRESKEFKSIFTTLHHPSRSSVPSTLTSVNTIVNKADPTPHAHKIARSPSNMSFLNPSPSTIRRVRSSGVTDVIQPFEDADVKTVPHGLPGKKRRRAMSDDHQSTDEEDGKENRRVSVMPSLPGGWHDSSRFGDEHKQEQDEGEKRGGKRARTAPATGDLSDRTAMGLTASPVKKPRQSSAREMAKQNAKDRKTGRGILSLSRLNMLARPKQRG
ncbi:uncharacterized protein A1O5_12474 [Cladophialophora psammophila CBS 110553]|uniref:Erythromycin esterase n=1 Tax=Cladophialophora psammophila CBS 110553 TaxID=1182543 RepID=W9WGP2_9EURO|nr:uncharacterized protein A1O5_12474 [Cladophialophora psammophila CBS 110553]EXJ57684.1 hypothetical protein A1O5_12474 [Cladophialophora psammophila CBS 110553]